MGLEGSWLVPVFVLFFLAALVLPVFFINQGRGRRFRRMRRHLRYPVKTNASFVEGERDVFVDVSCLSVGGMRIHTGAPLEKGRILHIKLLSPDSSEVVEASGKVVWVDPKSAYGVQFEEVDPNGLERIKTWTQTGVSAL